MPATISTDMAVTGSGRRGVTPAPAQTPAQVESNSVTLSEMAADPQVQSALDYYEYDKSEEFSDSYEESLKNFLSDYRFVQTNTYGTARFINYINAIEDREYLINLGVLYDKVDAELESQLNPYNEGVSTGDVVAGAAEYVGYAVADPINFIGGLVGKAVANASAKVARPLIQSGIKKAFTSRLKRMGTAAGVAASIEGPLAAGANVLLQEAEIDMEVREDISAAEVALSGAFGAGIGSLTGAAFSAPDPFKHSQKIIDALDAGPQGKASKQNSLADVGSASTVSRENINPAQPAVTPNSVQGLYVTISKDTPEGYDPMGRVVGARSDEVDIEFLSLKPEDLTRNSRTTKTVKLQDAKALTAQEVTERVAKYKETSGDFFDRTNIKEAEDAIALAKERLVASGFKPESFPIINDILANPTLTDQFNNVMRDLDVGIQKDLSKHVDLRANPTEQMASKIANVQMGLLPKTLTDLLTKEGMTLKEFAGYYRASVSKFAIGLKAQNDLPLKELNDIAARAGKDLAPSEKAAYRAAQDHALKDSKVNASWVDLWRSFIVSQPATTQRNVLGSLARAPGIAFRSKLDRLMFKYERQLQGLPDDAVAEDIIKEANSIDFLTRLVNPTDSIRTLEIFAKGNKAVQMAIKSTFDDHLAVEVDAATNIFLRGGYRVSKFVNTLNRMQDRAFKSAAFVAEMNNQIRFARSRGLFKNTDIKTFEDILATSGDPSTSKLDLITNEMVSDSLKAAYNVTYQARRAGDKLPIVGGMLNVIQESLSHPKLAQFKWFMPFPNFVINSFVHTINRASPFGAIKIVAYTYKNRGRKKLAPQKRARLDELVTLSKRTGEEEVELKDIKKWFGEGEHNLLHIKDGWQEQIEGLAFLGVAYAIRRSEFAGEQWDEVKISDDEYFSMKPLFPLAPFLLLADMMIRHMDDVPQREGSYKELITMVTGLEGRSGLGSGFFDYLLKSGEKTKSDDQGFVAWEKFGALVGATAGEIIGGFGTPARVVGDLMPPDEKPDLRQQTDFLIKGGVFTKGEVETDRFKLSLSTAFDEAAKAIVRGTPFEGALLDMSKVKHSPLTTKPVRPAPVPFIKQFTGTAAKTPTGIVEKEFNRLGILPYTMTRYSEVPEYRDKIEEELGRLSEDRVEEMLRNPRYLRMSDYKKKEFLIGVYKGKSKIQLPLQGPQKTTNLIKIAVQRVEDNFSTLAEFHKFKRELNNEQEDAVKNEIIRRDPEKARRVYENLQYAGEGEDGYKLRESIEYIRKVHKELKNLVPNPSDAVSVGLPRSTGGLMGRP